MIVVAHNGYADANSALVWAAQEAKRRGTTLRIVDALSMPAVLAGPGGSVDAVPDEVIESAHAVLKTAEDKARELGVTEVETAVEIGSPAAVLVRESKGAELLVIGSRGRGEFRAALLGSVSIGVSAHAKCPVVVVRQGVVGSLDQGHGVLVGSDGSEHSQHAVDFAAALADRAGVRMTVLGAWHIPIGAPIGGDYGALLVDEDVLERLKEQVEQQVDQVAAEVRTKYPTLDVATLVVEGEASAALSMASADAGLVVVGSRGHGGFTGLLLGSVSHQTIHDAHCPVAVVH